LNSFSCPNCSALISAPAVQTASSGQCPYCGHLIALAPPQVAIHPSADHVHRSSSKRRNRRKKKQNQIVIATVSICVLLLAAICFVLTGEPRKEQGTGAVSTNQSGQRQPSMDTERSIPDVDASDSSRKPEQHETHNSSVKETSRANRESGFSSTYTIASLSERLGSNSAIQTVLKNSSTPQSTLRAFSSMTIDGDTASRFYEKNQELLELLRLLQSLELHMRLANMPSALRSAAQSSFKGLDSTSVSAWSEKSALKLWVVLTPGDFSAFGEWKRFLKSQIGHEIQALLEENGRSVTEAEVETDREWPGFCQIVQSTLSRYSKQRTGTSYQNRLYTHSFSIRNDNLSSTQQRQLANELGNAIQSRVGRRIAALLTIRRDFLDGSFERGSPAEDLSLAILNFRLLRPN